MLNCEAEFKIKKEQQENTSYCSMKSVYENLFGCSLHLNVFVCGVIIIFY